MVDLLDQYYQVNPPPTHADNDDDSLYNDLVADRDREIAFRQAQGVDPDKTARANVLARQRGVPAPIVDGNLAAMEAQERAQKNAAIIKAYPAIGRWSADPRNSASAADDYEALGRIGATIKRKVEADKADFITGSGFFDRMGDLFKRAVYGLDAGAATVSAALQEWSAANPLPWTSEENRQKEQTSAAASRAIARISGQASSTSIVGETTWQDVKDRRSIGSVGGFVLDQGVGSLPGMAQAALGMPLYVLSQSGTIGQQRAENDGREDADIGDVVKASPAALVSAYMERLGIQSIFGAAGKTALKRVGQAAAGEATTEFLQSGIEYAGGTVGTEAGFDPKQAFEQGIAGAIAGAGMGAGFRGAGETFSISTRPVGKMVQRFREANAAAREATVIDELGKAAVSSKLRQRDPEAFSALIKSMAEDAGTESVYVPAEAMQAYMQSDGYAGDFDAFRDQIDEGLATGGDVVIPLETAVTAFAGTPAWAAIKDDMRLTPGGMSTREAATFDEQMADVMADLSEKMETGFREQKAAQAPRDKLLQTITDKLMNAGFTPSTARTQAELLTQRVATRSARKGLELTGDEFSQVEVRQVLPEKLAQAQKADTLDMTVAVMRGKQGKVVSAGSPNSVTDDMRHAAQDLRALLETQGIDADTASAKEIRAAVEKYVAERAQGLGYDQAESDRTWANNVDRVIRGEWPGGQIRVGSVPDILRQVGLSAADIVMASGKLARVRREHPEVSIGVLKALPQLLRTPDAAFSSGKDDGSIIVAIPAQDADGNPVIVPMLAQPKGRNVVLSVYGKSQGYSWIQNQISRAKESGAPIYVREGFADAQPKPGPTEATPSSPAPIAADGPAKPERKILSLRPKDKNVYDQSFADGPRGRITFPAAGFGTAPTFIDLFQSRDQSTFLHEAGHMWLEELRLDAMDADASDQLKADWQAVQDWFKANGHPLQDGIIPVEAHEMWARGVERYLMEGKSPTPTLTKIFQTLKSWLVQVYRTVAKLNAPITDDIRAVMDRLIATDEEIAQAKETQALEAGFTEKPATMSEDEWTAYRKLTEDATVSAHDTMLAKVMAAIKRRVTKEYKDLAASVRAEVEEEINARPEFRAIRQLRETPIDAAWLKETYGDDAGAMMPKSVPPLFREQGANADEVAELSGFTSGDEMVRTLMGVETRRQELRKGGDQRSVRKALIDQETDSRMLARYGDPFTDGSIEEEALAAVHNEKQGEVLAAEMRVLARSTGDKPTPYRVAKAWAARTISEGIVKDVVSKAAIQRYRRAAQKAGKASTDAILAGDMAEAFRQKQAQMLNNALLSEANRVSEEVDRAQRRLEKWATKRTVKSVDQDYLERAQALLEQVEMRPRSQKSLDRQAQFEAWANEQEALGHDIVVPASFAASLGTTNWSRLSVEQFLGLDAAVDQIIHLGRLKQTLIDNKEARDFDEVVREAEAGADRIGRKPPSNLMEPGWKDRIASGIADADAALLKMETVFGWLDNEDPNGVFNRIVFRPIAEAEAREKAMLTDYYGQVRAAFEKVDAKQLRRWQEKFSDPTLMDRNSGLPFEMKREHLIAMALNMGNEGNIQRLADGYGWNETAIREVLNRELSEQDWKFVQQIWDIVDGLWPEIAALERRVNGVEPEKVGAKPVETPFGTLKGGYYPAIYDSTKDYAAEQRAAKASDLMEASYTRSTTRASSTKDRAQKVSRPILLQLGVINRHLGEVIHDITHREAVMQADKFLTNPRVMKAIDETLGPEIRKQMRPWLKFVANQWAVERAGNEGIGKWIGKARAHATIVGMGFRATTILTQIAGYSNSYEYVGAGWVNQGIAAMVRHPGKTFDFVMEKSAEVRGRMDTIDRDIREEMLRMAGSNKAVDALTAAKRFAFHGIGYADRVVVIPTWIGAYNKALSQGMTDDQAVYAADKAVRLSQGSGSPKDLASVQRGTGNWGQFLKLMTMFYTYMSAFYQRQRTLGRDVARAEVSDIPALVARAWWLVIVPPVLAGILSGNGPEDDEDWGTWAFKEMLFNALGPIPVVRDLARPAWDKAAGNRGFDYQLSPVQRAGQTIVNTAGDIGKMVRGEETKRATRNALEAAGYITGLVPGQIAATTQFLVDVSQGDQDPETFGEWWEGLTKGRIKED